MSKRRRDSQQSDLFGASVTAAAVYPVRRPVERVRPVDLSLRIKTAMGQALKESPDNAAVIAARMSEMLGQEITADALYSYTAPAKPDHQISIVRFVAFVRVTEAWWLWDVLVEDDGLIVMEGREARLAQLGLLEQQRQEAERKLKALRKELKERPVAASAVRRRGL